MDCKVARDLIDQSIEPGCGRPEQVELGFHLAICSDCRWYRERLQSIRAARMQPPPRIRRAGPQDLLAVAERRRLPLPDPALWRIVLAAVGTCILLVMALFSSVALRAYNNVDTMVVAQARGARDGMGAPSTTATIPSSAPMQAAPAKRRRSAAGIIAHVGGPREMPDAADSAAPADAGGPLTVLVLGVDRRPGDTRQPHTDAIIVVHLDPTASRASILSLPRDLWVAIPGFGHGRINSAYARGEAARVPGGGAALARATVSKLLDVPIDAYVLVDFQGFIGLIDTIGGISVDVERELYDSRYPTLNNGYQEVYFAPGPAMLDGATALVYSRIRHSDSDFQRIKRQQQVLGAVFERLSERGVLRNLAEVDRLTAALRDNVRTDIPQERMLSLGWAMRDLDPTQVRRLVVSPELVTMGVGADLYAEVPDIKGLRRLAAELY